MYLYHQVPSQMVGSTIVPLHTLEDMDGKLYEEALRSYASRPYVLENIVPFLNCPWSEIVFLTAVHPTEWRATFDYLQADVRGWKFFQIDVCSLDTKKLVALSYSCVGKETYRKFKTCNILKYGHIPSYALAYFAGELEQGRRPYWHHLVPQILYKGTINVSTTPIITV